MPCRAFGFDRAHGMIYIHDEGYGESDEDEFTLDRVRRLCGKPTLDNVAILANSQNTNTSESDLRNVDTITSPLLEAPSRANLIVGDVTQNAKDCLTAISYAPKEPRGLSLADVDAVIP